MPDKPKAGWGARIFEARSAMLGRVGKKMTQADLGQAVGLSYQQISRYESEADEPSYDTWKRMAGALMMTPGDLMFGKAADAPEPVRTRR